MLKEQFLKYQKDYPLLIIGIRNSNNKRGIYDDKIIVSTPNVFEIFTGNTDPSSYRKGKGIGVGKGMATLKEGLWKAYKFGIHKTYPALIQTGGKVTVTRDGINGDYEDTGHFGINIHKGGIRTTSSEGCQTIKKDEWDRFYNLVKSEAVRIFGNTNIVIPYLLINEATLSKIV
jgi:hypothetical protein